MNRVSLTFSHGNHLCVVNCCGGKRRQNAILCFSFTVFDETTNCPRQDTTKSFPRGEFLWVWKESSCLANGCTPWPLRVFHFIVTLMERSDERTLRPVLFWKSGSLSHRQWSSKSAARRPRVQSSAGLQWPGTCLHCAGSVVSWISATRLATNVWKRRLPLAMYCNTVFESLQKMASLMLTVNSCFTTQYNLTAKTAAWNSKRGMLNCFRGATRFLAITNETLIVPSGSEYLT